MNSKLSSFILLFLCSIFLTASVFAEGKDEKKSQTFDKSTGTPIISYLNINNISTVFWNNGYSDIDDQDANSGFVFPKGSGKTAVFKSGFIWGAKITGDPQVRVGGSTYRSGLQGGRITNSGLPWQELAFESESAPNARIYRVRPDIIPSSGPRPDPYTQGSVASEIANNEGTAESIVAQYEKDWNEWPAADGAPYNDVNGNGTYEPGQDIPGVPGADQTIWFVANDLNQGRTQNMYGTLPLGIEMQATYWAYSQTGALGNMFFRKYKIINKSNEVFNDMYVSMWSDVDLGNSTDDFAGCDTSLSLGYVYNALASDPTYSPLPPPAVGFDFFQGPLLQGVAGEDKNKNGIDDAEDFAIFDNDSVGPGYINLPMTAFYYFARGDASVVDPTQGSIEGANQFYNFMQGRIGISGEFFTDPNTGQSTTFAVPGDPLTRTGWVDGQLIGLDDRRIGSASGPFQMQPGDIQEVVVAEIIAGAIPGVDRISAIGLLKFYDQTAQVAYNNFFDLPVPPPPPIVTTAELENKIVLEWSSNLGRVAETEGYDAKGYTFQGYNVYQLPSASSPVSEGIRIATFDVDDGIGKISDQVFDTQTGSVVVLPVQFGNDTGIKRYITITQDALNQSPLINGIRYYFAVTAYNFNPDPLAVPNNLENPISILTLVPHSPDPGTRFLSTSGDTVTTWTHEGPGDGSVLPIVVDPSKITGDSYRVNFEIVNDEYVWNITNVTKNTVAVRGQSNQTGDDLYPIIDGLLMKVLGPPPGMKDFDFTGTRTITFAGTGSATNWGSEGYSGSIGNAFDQWFSGSTVTYDQLTNVELRFANTDTLGNFDVNQDNVSFGYRYMRGANAAPAREEFAPYILNPSTGYAFQEFIKNVPLAAYNTETDPPTRLAVGFLENNGENAVLDGKYFPVNHDAEFADNIATSGPREWLYIFNVPYSETQDPALATDILNTTMPIMWFLTVNRRFNVPFSSDDTFTILTNHINTPADVFNISTSEIARTIDQAAAKEDVGKINVFPNPYYGVNSEELNKYNRFVTFSHLPANATIRIFNLAGVLVKTIEKNDASSQFQRWDLANDSGLPVASGLYIAYIDLPDVGETKILKVAIIQEQQILDRF